MIKNLEQGGSEKKFDGEPVRGGTNKKGLEKGGKNLKEKKEKSRKEIKGKVSEKKL